MGLWGYWYRVSLRLWGLDEDLVEKIELEKVAEKAEYP